MSKTIKGHLDPYFDSTGEEKLVWTLREDGGSLRDLKSGDLMKVFKDETRSAVIWQGKVDFEAAKDGQTVAGYPAKGLQKDENPEKWGRMFFEGKPAEVVRRDLKPVK